MQYALVMTINRQRRGLGDQKFINRDILSAFLAMSTVLHSTKRRFSRRAVARILYQVSFIATRVQQGSLTRPIIPASKFSNSLQSLSTFFVKT